MEGTTEKSIDFKDSVVFLRVDMNVPINKITGRAIDDHRILDGVHATKWCLEMGAYVVVLIAHQGRKKEDTLKHHLAFLENHFPNKIKFVANLIDLTKAVKDANAGDVLLLENIRSLDEEKDYTDVTQTLLYKTFKETERETGKKVIYAKDDFAVCHRKDLSVYGLPKQLKAEGYQVVAGQLLRNELERARIAREKMQKRKIICLWGGGKFEDYLHLFEPFLLNYKDSIILISGPLALLMLKAIGKNIGENESVFGINEELVSKSAEVMKKFSDRIIMPKDFYVENSTGKECVNCDNINGLVVDIGPETIEMFRSIVSQNPNSIIIGNGPLGQYEKLENAKGSIQVYNEVFNPQHNHFIIGGGGDFNAMIDLMGYKNYMRSSAGKAFLELLVFGSLPGLEFLDLKL